MMGENAKALEKYRHFVIDNLSQLLIGTPIDTRAINHIASCLRTVDNIMTGKQALGGSFVMSVVKKDWQTAILLADEFNLMAIKVFVLWMNQV